MHLFQTCSLYFLNPLKNVFIWLKQAFFNTAKYVSLTMKCLYIWFFGLLLFCDVGSSGMTILRYQGGHYR